MSESQPKRLDVKTIVKKERDLSFNKQRRKEEILNRMRERKQMSPSPLGTIQLVYNIDSEMHKKDIHLMNWLRTGGSCRIWEYLPKITLMKSSGSESRSVIILGETIYGRNLR
jgi:hypothetical protein